VQTIAAFGSLAKSGLAVGIVVLIGVCAFTPFVKILAIAAVYKLMSAIIQPLGEKAVTECIDEIGNVISLFLGIIAMLVIVSMGTVLIFVSLNGG